MATPAAPEVGKTYTVRHSRKGVFVAKVEAVHEDFVDLRIVNGVAHAMLPENVRYAGEDIQVRTSLATFEEVS